MKRMLSSWIGLAIVAVLLVGLNIVSFHFFRGMRMDVTENKLYTLTDGTRSVLADVPEPITLELYYSRRLAAAHAPGLTNHMTRVQELLGEYRDAAGGNIQLRVIEPEPFSEEEDEAALAGVTSIPVGAQGDPMFAGLVGRNRVGDQSVLPFFDPGKEAFLEYEITKLVYELSNPRRRTLGILSTLPIFGDTDPMAPMRPDARQDPWVIVEQLRQMYDVVSIDPTDTHLPDGLDVLMLVHPKEFAEELLYSIDQFVLAGGNAIVFVDPMAELDDAPFDPQNPYGNLWRERHSDAGPLLEAWGVRMPTDKFVADRDFARRVSWPGARGVTEAVDFLPYIGIDPESMNEDDIVTAGIGEVTFGTAGSLSAAEGATTTFFPLIHSSANAALMDTERVRFGPNPSQLLQDFEASGEEYILAARVSGPASTAFPDWPERQRAAEAQDDQPVGGLSEEVNGEPTGTEEDTGDEEQSSGAEAEARPHIARSNGGINVIVVADTDMLADRFWIEMQNFFGQRMGFPFASNGDFVLNAIENLSGSEALISVRSRGRSTRPFTVVQELAREADTRFRERQQELEMRLAEIEDRINEIQRARADAGASLFLTEEQQAILDEAREQQVETRRELREVRRQLNRDIEQLGLRVKIINIAAMPIIVSIAAIALGISRRIRRRMHKG